MKTPDGETITLQVESSYSLQKVKQKIEDAGSFDSENQILIFDDEVLENGKTVADYSV